MALSVRILPEAEREVDEIAAYLAGHGPRTLARFLDKYEEQLELLATGRVDYGLCKLPELARLGYHSCHVNSYIMLYFFEGDEVIVAHVFHHSQDYARLV